MILPLTKPRFDVGKKVSFPAFSAFFLRKFTIIANLIVLISFSVENFRSFKDRQSLILKPSSDGALAETHIAERDGVQALKGAAIYGANASGKSSLIDALLQMRMMVLVPNSEVAKANKLDHEPHRLSTATQGKPTVLEVEFAVDARIWRYGFAYTSAAIVEEWLFSKGSKGREASHFEREGQQIKTSKIKFKGAEDFIPRTRDVSLFLSVCDEWNHPVAKVIVDWFRQLRSVSGLSESGFFGFTAHRLLNAKTRKSLLKFAQRADFGIQSIESELKTLSEDEILGHLPDEVRKKLLNDGNGFAEIKTTRTVYDTKGQEAGTTTFDLQEEESQGTLKFVALSGPLQHTVEEGSILIVDELEARLHPNLTKALVKWFFGPANRKGAQLIFATHETNVMIPEILRRDQIWFCEKNEQGASSFYCLDDFDSNQVRPTTRFGKNYLQGIFGAVPRLALDEFTP